MLLCFKVKLKLKQFILPLLIFSLHLLLQSEQVLEVQQPVHESGVWLSQVCAQGLDELRKRGAQEGRGGRDYHHRRTERRRARGRGDPSAPAGAGAGHTGSAFVLQEVRHASTSPILPEIPPG